MMLRILLVDDDQIALDGLQRFVDWGSMGFQVAGTALSAKDAVRFMESSAVDALLTDIVLVGATGFDLIRNAQLINPSLKTVVISSYSTFSYAKEALRLGVFDYLSKPVDFRELRGIFGRLQGVLCAEAAERTERLLQQKVRLQENPPERAAGNRAEIGPVIENVLSYIGAHYAEDVTLQTLSEIAYVHPIYLSKLFKEKTGVNFIDYLTRVRVETAERLLEDLSLRIYDVSEMVGYDSPKYFSKVFKGLTGLTPKEYRGRLHEAQQTGSVS